MHRPRTASSKRRDSASKGQTGSSVCRPNHFQLAIEYVPTEDVSPYKGHARRYTKKALRKLEAGIREFGFCVPIIIDDSGTIIAGHARFESAKRIGMDEVPAIRVTDLSDAQIKAFRIFDNRSYEDGEWDFHALAIELSELIELDFDLELTGFDIPEIDHILDADLPPMEQGPEDDLPPIDRRAVSREGDLWRLEEHAIFCGDARKPISYELALHADYANMVFTDPPYNVPIQGHVSGKGKSRHDEFVMASGEMSPEAYEALLEATIVNLARFSRDGSVHFLCIDWRHLDVLSRLCRRLYSEQLNLCVWAKSNGGMGSMYRSQHELVLVYKNGTANHVNNVQLGRYGRNRSNVWQYAGCNSFGADRDAELAMHPTVKPVALIADAILDCSRPNDLVLDPFLGSGSTLIACEKMRRICAGIELDPRYVDVAVRRWQTFTGGTAYHGGTELSFAEMAAQRADLPLLPPPDDEPAVEV